MEPSTMSAAPHTPTTSSTTSLSNASSSHSPSSSPSLPFEILADIFELATFGNELVDLQKMYIAFSKVSRTWSHATRDALSTIVVEGSERAEQLAKSLADESKAGSTRRNIESLVLIDEGHFGGQERGDRFALLVNVLRVDFEVTSSTFICTDPLCSSPDIFAASLPTALMSLTHLKTFALRQSKFWNQTPCVRAHDLNKLLSSWKKLEHLDIAHHRVDVPFVGAGRSLELPFTLHSIKCRHATLKTLSKIAYVRKLHVTDAWITDREVPIVIAALERFATSVEELELPHSFNTYQSSNIGSSLHDTLEALTRIKRLRLQLSIVDPSTILTSLRHLTALEHLQLLCSNAESTYYGAHPEGEDVAKFLADMPQLKWLVVSWRTQDAWRGDGMFEAVESAAQDAGVALVVRD